MEASRGASDMRRMNPLTLRFYDEELERLLRAKAFHSSFRVYLLTMGVHVALHIMLPLLLPRCAMVSAVFMPICVIAFAFRIYIAKMEDQERAHRFCSRHWLASVCVSFTAHRVLIGMEMQTQIHKDELLLYMLSIALEIIMMHLQHFEFSYVMVMNAFILMHSGTPGWNSGWQINHGPSLSIMGQPHDLAIVMVTILVANFVGHSVEAMLRSSFLVQLDQASANSAKGVDQHVAVDASSRNYEVLGLIGRGSSSEVFLVRDAGGSTAPGAPGCNCDGWSSSTSSSDGSGGGGPSSGKRVYALKRISKLRMRPNQLAQIAEECAIHSALQHPYIVHLRDAFETDYGFYMAMTYAAGGDLGCYMHVVTPSAALIVFAEMLSALGYLHSLKVVYRDLKPENTLVERDGHILLSDFGVSKRISATRRIGARTMVGTYAYMSPEQLRGEDYGCFVDFWAVAVLLHEMLTGDVPSNLDADFKKRARGGGGGAGQPDTEAPVGLSSELSAEAADLIGRMLIRDRECRLGTGENDLGRICAHSLLTSIDMAAISHRKVPGPLAAEVRMPRLTLGPAQEGGLRTLSGSWQLTTATHAVPRPPAQRGHTIASLAAAAERPNAARRTLSSAAEVDQERRRIPRQLRPSTSPVPSRPSWL